MDRSNGINLLSLLIFILVSSVSCEKIDIDETLTDEDETTINISVEGTPSLYIHEGHVGVSSTDSTLLLISKEEWNDLSANSERISRITSSYAENGITSWRQPTKEEARLLKSLPITTTIPNASSQDNAFTTYTFQSLSEGPTAAPLNFILSAINATPISLDCRYLCESCTYSFSFSSGTTISKVGTKKSDYHLRLVKTIAIRDVIK